MKLPLDLISDDFKANGFVRIEELISQTQIQKMLAEIDRIQSNSADYFKFLQPEPDQEQTIRKIKNLTDISPLFLEVAKSKSIKTVVEHFLGSTIRLHGGIGWLKPKRVGCAMHPHQDAVYWNHIAPQTFVVCWIPLENSTLENGCLRYLKKSHQLGEVKHLGDRSYHLDLNDFTDYEEAPVELKSGDVVFHDGFTIHWSSENLSENPRRAVSFSYFPTTSLLRSTHFKETDFPLID